MAQPATGAAAVAHLRRQLAAFVFFHLGSDARVEVRTRVDGLQVSLKHSRIHPCSFELSSSEVERLATNDRGFENFLLQRLTHYRRS